MDIRGVASMKRFRFIAAVCLLALFVSGCSTRHDETASRQTLPSSACPGIFVLAPAEYLLYFNGEDPVILASEGRYEDLPVYCGAEEALQYKHALEAGRKLHPGLWQLYALEGVWEVDVVEVEPGQFRMRRPSELLPYPECRVAVKRS